MTNLYNKGLAASKKSERNEPDKSYQFKGVTPDFDMSLSYQI